MKLLGKWEWKLSLTMEMGKQDEMGMGKFIGMGGYGNQNVVLTHLYSRGADALDCA